MKLAPLTMDIWRQLVANHPRRAWLSQWSDATDSEMDYVGERLIADGWTVPRAAWCVRQAVALAYSPKGFLRVLTETDAGTRDRDGNRIGGWLQSPAYLALCDDVRDDDKRDKCRAAIADGVGRCTRDKGYCGDCERSDTRRTRGVKDAGAMSQAMVKSMDKRGDDGGAS